MSDDSISKLAAAILKYQEADQDQAAKKAHSKAIAKLLMSDVDSSLTSTVARHAETIKSYERTLSASRTSMMNEMALQEAEIKDRLKLTPSLLKEIVKIAETDPAKAAHHYWMKAVAPTIFGWVGLTIATLLGLLLLMMGSLLWTAWKSEARIIAAKTQLLTLEEEIEVESQVLATFTSQTNGVTITQVDGRMLLTLPPELKLKTRGVSPLNPLLNTERNNQYWIE